MPPPVGLGVDRRRRMRQGTRGLAHTLLRFAVASAAELVTLPSSPLAHSSGRRYPAKPPRERTIAVAMTSVRRIMALLLRTEGEPPSTAPR